VGIIVVEIGLAAAAGWIEEHSWGPIGRRFAQVAFILQYVALVHILGHACLRALQFLRAPTLLHDYHLVENAIGEPLPQSGAPLGRLTHGRAATWLYGLALGRGYLDAALLEFVVLPVVRAFRWCDRWERRFTDWVSGEAARESDEVKSRFGTFEEVS
jgi:NADH-quinone oxidoreductase subunit L